MVSRVRLFVDFWNFQLHWNDHFTPAQRCDWPRLPAAFVGQARQVMAVAGIEETL